MQDLGLSCNLRRFSFQTSHLTMIVTYITIAEFFIILPQGPNCWKGQGAFKERVRLKIIK
jgi:hypothetical protein